MNEYYEDWYLPTEKDVLDAWNKINHPYFKFHFEILRMMDFKILNN
jgi:hypothetical protein